MHSTRSAPLGILALRWFLGVTFLLSGLSKLFVHFPNLIGPTWLEDRLAPHGLALFARFVAACEAGVGALLLTRSFATLGAIMLVPLLAGIFMVTVSLEWRGTPYVVALMLLFNAILLGWDYPKLRHLIDEQAPVPASPAPRLRADLVWLAILAGIILLATLPALRGRSWGGVVVAATTVLLILLEWRRARPLTRLPVDRLNMWVVLVPLAALSAACTRPASDPDADRAALLRLHDLQREAHISKQAQLLTGTFADTFYSIARGRVTTPTRAESDARLSAYFAQSTFLEWDDIAPPIVSVSPDGQMAYIIVQKRVRLTSPDSTGHPGEERTDFAWLETWEKRDGQWRLTTVASTDRPGD